MFKKSLLVLVTIAIALTFGACSEDEPSIKLMTEQFNKSASQQMAEQTGLPAFMSGEILEVLDKYKDGEKTVMNVKTRTTMTMSPKELEEKAAQELNGDRIQARMLVSLVVDALGGSWNKGDTIEEEGELVFAKTEKSWKLLEIRQ